MHTAIDKVLTDDVEAPRHHKVGEGDKKEAGEVDEGGNGARLVEQRDRNDPWEQDGPGVGERLGPSILEAVVLDYDRKDRDRRDRGDDGEHVHRQLHQEPCPVCGQFTVSDSSKIRVFAVSIGSKE